MTMKKNNIINDWLTQKGDQEIDRLVKRNLAIASKVRRILHGRGLSDKKFAKMLGKTPSEVSKWLSGSHNLTQKSIIKMEMALDVQLIYVEQVHKYVYLGKIEGNMKKEVEEYKKSMPAYAS